MLFEIVGRAYEHHSLLITTNLPSEQWTEVFGSERLTGLYWIGSLTVATSSKQTGAITVSAKPRYRQARTCGRIQTLKSIRTKTEPKRSLTDYAKSGYSIIRCHGFRPPPVSHLLCHLHLKWCPSSSSFLRIATPSPLRTPESSRLRPEQYRAWPDSCRNRPNPGPSFLIRPSNPRPARHP